MMKRFVAATTAAMLCAAAGNCAFAQDAETFAGKQHAREHHMNRDDFGDPARMLEMLTRHLDLDEAQAQTISGILEAARPEIEGLRERAQAARKAVHDLDVSEPDYYAKLNNLSLEIGTLTSEATLLHGRLRAEVYAQLTPEQRERAAEGRQKMHERFRHRGLHRWHGEEQESPDTE